MEIQGLQKMTLLDYPGKVACTVFLGGCDLRCPFCHNGELVEGEITAALDDGELTAFLKKRQGLLDGVCVTGGEPLLRPELEGLLGRIKELGFPVKLDTNGSHPDRLRRLTEAGLLDYVAMDTQAKALMEVASGTSDAAIIDLLMAGAMIGEGTDYANLAIKDELNAEEYGAAFRKGSDAADAVNAAFDELKADDTMQALADKYSLTLAD